MPTPESTARKERERAFHDERFTVETRQKANKYYEVDAGKQRYRELVLGSPQGARVLEYGCGTGSLAPDLAERGMEVTGIDISPVAVEAARTHAAALGVAAEFREMDAEALRFPDDTFDVVCGSGILHHLDLSVALAEIARVLRPSGSAVFFEPLGHNPLINVYRRLTPSMRTDDEHPLVVSDLEGLRNHFGSARAEVFDLTALAAVAIRKIPGGDRLTPTLHGIDQWLFARSRVLRRWAWVTVIDLRDPITPGSAST